MKTSPSRILGFTLSAAMAVGGLFATVPANADPEDSTPDVASTPAPAVTSDDTAEQAAVTAAETAASSEAAAPAVAAEPAAASVTTDDAPNVITDANLRACIAQTMWYMGTGFSPGSAEFQTQAQSITQANLDALAAASVYNYNLNCSGVSSLAGLENLHDPQLAYLYMVDGQIQDLSPLAGLTGLQELILSNNQISDVAPLAGLPLRALDLSNNKISNVAPLAGLTQLNRLYLHNNQITDITPLASMINAGTVNQGDSAYPFFKLSWSLSGNQITDVSSLNWDNVGKAWLQVPSEYQNGIYNYSVKDQTMTQARVVGTTVALPQVTQAVNDPHTLTWSVVSGNATINQAAGTVTYNSVGAVQLKWADAFTAACPSNAYRSTCSPGDGADVNLSFFSGTVSVNVTAPGAPAPTPSAPESEAVKVAVTASTTGGAARLADGTDTYTLITTIRSENGQALTGYASDLTSVAPSGVSVSKFHDNGNGTYSATVSSATPGNYTVKVVLDDSTLATIPVNFIGADIQQATRLVGEAQSAEGLGFLPGEKVTVTLHSDPISLGVFTADDNGTVTVPFTLPTDFNLGRHTVEFNGDISGVTSVGFDVVANPEAQTGGTAVAGSSMTPALVLAFSLCAAAAFSLTMGMKRRSR